MSYQLFEEVILLEDVVEKGLLKGDVATIVEYHPLPNGEDGYSLEAFNVLGDTIAVITLPKLALGHLTENEIFSVRQLAV
jgi:hypothetical protein